MSKKLQVLVVFEFPGIDDPDSIEADMAIDCLAEVFDHDNRIGYTILEETGASAVWVQDAMVVEDEVKEEQQNVLGQIVEPPKRNEWVDWKWPKPK